MKLLGKCGLNTQHLALLNSKGCQEFELFLNITMTSKEYLERNLQGFREEMDKNGMKCVAVHTPYDDSIGNINERTLISFGGYNSHDSIISNLEQILKICNALLLDDGYIIYHLGCGIPIIDRTDDMIYNLTKIREERLGKAEITASRILDVLSYTKYKMAVENIMVFDYEKCKLTYSVIGNGYDNLKFVNRLRDKGYKNIYSLLDTCHFGTSMFSMNEIDTFKEVIVKYKDTLGMMHLADGTDISLDKTKHGNTFSTPEGTKRIIDVIEILLELNLDIPLTLEVSEIAFDEKVGFLNYVETRDLIENILSTRI